jgi:predicted DNA-binding antitoxin AbrB/MazE fold protein
MGVSLGENIMPMIHAIYENGVFRPIEPVDLPERCRVEVRVVPAAEATRPSLAERFGDVIGQARDLPEDMAQQHDHYLHGTPRK